MRSGILTSEYVYSSWLSHSHSLLQSQEVDIVGRVDGLCHTVDVVGHRDAPSQLRVVLNVVYTATDGKGAEIQYHNVAVWVFKFQRED